VSELDNLIAQAIEGVCVDENEVTVLVGDFSEEVVQRTISRLIDADYRVSNSSVQGGFFSGNSPSRTLKISWSE
jgi:hypothetical protein